ncbi:GAF domain-containing sensor histidine kinase [Paenibacillus sp. G2S3]|uniref:GAF domain-containing sensor histidine kinase n=1 Tax=Paenibacillus sp. G2S3 TaxID=3047872 RepID=UPI0024C1770A|nr:GAF domain-containing sensor histidine kinase [Paenibacillus sp. G2S3]WHY19267.1 GAF domain-containing sensor histidine kinase [Paenibacillus sp. G2S3]
MPEETGIHELLTLKTIAETLNSSNELKPMLDTVMGKLLDLTGNTAGWIFLSEENMEYEFAADRGLPPALQRDNKQPMQYGSCWCLDRLWDGRLEHAVNILNCKRLSNARQYKWGDTLGITHHATIPLYSGERYLGLMNVAAPGKAHYPDSELALLQSVALQIGSAIERMQLYSTEQRRANLYSKLGEFSAALNLTASECISPSILVEKTTALIGQYFDWPFAAIIGQHEGKFEVHAAAYAANITPELAPFELSDTFKNRLRDIAKGHRFATLTSDEEQEITNSCCSEQPITERVVMLAVPFRQITAQGSAILLITSPKALASANADGEVLEAIAEHISATLESVQLGEKRREIARLDERNRLARDLHDSVNQILFSLSMTAKGVESMLKQENTSHPAAEAVRDIQELSQSALKEMRALIMQLRPAGLEAGLLTALQTHGQQLGLLIQTQRSGVLELPRNVEEGLLRIGQEALNNVRKHSGASKAEVSLHLNATEAILSIADQGKGGAKRRCNTDTNESLGLHIMKERAEALYGRIQIHSEEHQGTTVEVTIPLPLQST